LTGLTPKLLTAAAIFAVANINKELTTKGHINAAIPILTIGLVNGGLMAKPAFSGV
jgi:hypothetical protein